VVRSRRRDVPVPALLVEVWRSPREPRPREVGVLGGPLKQRVRRLLAVRIERRGAREEDERGERRHRVLAALVVVSGTVDRRDAKLGQLLPRLVRDVFVRGHEVLAVSTPRRVELYEQRLAICLQAVQIVRIQSGHRR